MSCKLLFFLCLWVRCQGASPAAMRIRRRSFPAAVLSATGLGLSAN